MYPFKKEKNMKTIILSLFIILTSISTYALPFKVGDYIEYEIYVNGKYEQIASQEILSHDLENNEFILNRISYLDTPNPIARETHVPVEEMQTPESGYDECVVKNGLQAITELNGTSIRTCQILENGNSYSFSKDVPFNMIESTNTSGKISIKTKLVKFKTAH
jgi:hypothetical protein